MSEPTPDQEQAVILAAIEYCSVLDAIDKLGAARWEHGAIVRAAEKRLREAVNAYGDAPVEPA